MGESKRCKHHKFCCFTCHRQRFCTHERRNGTCYECKGNNFCKHDILKWDCTACGGANTCKHAKEGRSCRLCFPLAWAKRIITQHKAHAKRKGYAAPNITAENLLALIKSSNLCCGCGEVLDFTLNKFKAPCMHHSHETGEVIGFAHRECNALEGQLQKLGSRLPIFLKNFFPQQVGL